MTLLAQCAFVTTLPLLLSKCSEIWQLLRPHLVKPLNSPIFCPRYYYFQINISKTTSSKDQAHRQKFDVDERCLDPHLHLHWQRPVFLEKEKSLDSYPVLGLVLMRFHCCCGLLEAYPFSFLIWWYTMLVTDGHDAAVFILKCHQSNMLWYS